MNNPMIWPAVFVIGGFGLFAVRADQPREDERVVELKSEVRSRGWVAYSARSENGTWDLFLSRPDGSQRRNITNTPNFEEAAPRFSPDSKKMLYRRLARGTAISHDMWGFQGRLVMAHVDGTNPVAIGEEGQYPWASWSPDGKQIACLTKKEIQVVDLATKEVARTFPSQGIFQQLHWSSDGKWFCGVANYAGEAMWTIVRMNVRTGKLNPVHKFFNCTPDWFPDSKHIIFSSRPAHLHEESQGYYGWTQLWMADGEGKNQRLVYGEDGFHIYGGALSPDGKYVLFTKCPVDGAESKLPGAPIFIMRLADAPTIGGESTKLRKKHPNTKDGAVLRLPQQGWEPSWTYAEIFPPEEQNEQVIQLAREVRNKGWIVFSARSENGSWDLFLSRPDGSQRHNITNTPHFEEVGARFSPDSKKMLYRRLAGGTQIKGAAWGLQGQVVIANADGTNPVVIGEEGEYPWASWSSDGKQIACLSKGEGIQIVDLKAWEVAIKEVSRKIPGKGIHAMFNWSGDGKWFCGTGNWDDSRGIVRVNVRTGELNLVYKGEKGACTPDWFPDSKHVVFSSRPANQPGNDGYGWTQLWMGDGEGKSSRLLYGRDGCHIYGGGLSPDGKYLLFTEGPKEDGAPELAGAPICIMRLADAPTIGGESKDLRKVHPHTKDGPVLRLAKGWEPNWTYAEVVPPEDPRVAELAKEVRDKGWIVCSARSRNGSWDLFMSRPDGSRRRNFTNTPGYHEAAPRFSHDYKKMLYRRIDGGSSIPGATYGFQEGRLVIADADGSKPQVISEPGQYPWATWSPDGRHLAYVIPKGIKIMDLATMKVVREMPRKGTHAFLTYSPNGKWFCGTANWGEGWGIGRINIETGEINGVQQGPACTCDWHPDSKHIVCSSRPPGQDGPDSFGWTQAVLVTGDGKSASLVYGEDGYHVYGSAFSPDGKYFVFTKCAEDNSGREGASIYTMRSSDAPMITGESRLLRKKYPNSKDGPILRVAQGWEPIWTYEDTGARK